MKDTGRTYIAIDLKSFYASVECVERGLDPLTTNLVVADRSRTEKTICLAVSPSLKAYGIPGRARLFEVEQRLKEVNAERRRKSYGHRLTGKSTSDTELKAHPDWEVDYIAATPRMAYYIETGRWTISPLRPAWLTTSNTVPVSIRYISTILPRRTSMYIQ